jgi:hypothetical protein
MIPPVDPLGGGELHLLEGSPGTVCADHLGLVQAVDGFPQGIVTSGTRADSDGWARDMAGSLPG